MATYPVGDILQAVLKNSKWKNRLDEIRIKENWEKITGKAVAKYTQKIILKDGILFVFSEVAVLKQELHMGRNQLKNNINLFLEENVVKEVVIR